MRTVLIYAATDQQEHFCRYNYLFEQHIQSSNIGIIINCGAVMYQWVLQGLHHKTDLILPMLFENDKQFRFVITFIFYHIARNKVITYMTHFLNFANSAL